MVSELGFAFLLVGLTIIGMVVLYRYGRRHKQDPKLLWLNSLLSLIVRRRVIRGDVRAGHSR